MRNTSLFRRSLGDYYGLGENEILENFYANKMDKVMGRRLILFVKDSQKEIGEID